MNEIFFSGWQPVLRILIVCMLAYVALVAALRVSGKRTLSKLNAFDLVITVALGSTLATVILSKDIALFEGITALVSLVGLQYLVTWTNIRSKWFKNMVTGEPSLLLYRGQPLQHAMHRQRVLKQELQAAVRASGKSCLSEVAAIVLETDGSLSVVTETQDDELLKQLPSQHHPTAPTD